MNQCPQARICLIDDDENVRDSLEALFRSRRLRLSVFSDPERFLSIWKTSELREVPAMFVIDVAMPGLSGVELFRRMREHGLPPYNAVIFLTGHGDVTLAVEAMRQGAYDFIEKPCSDNSLVDRVLDGARVVERAFDCATHRIRYETVLSARERDVADLIARGMSNKEIARHVAIAVRTVEMHRARVFNKMEIRNAVHLAEVLRSAGCGNAPLAEATRSDALQSCYGQP